MERMALTPVAAWIQEHAKEVGENFMARSIGKLRYAGLADDGSIEFEKTSEALHPARVTVKPEEPILYCISGVDCDLVQNAVLLNSSA